MPLVNYRASVEAVLRWERMRGPEVMLLLPSSDSPAYLTPPVQSARPPTAPPPRRATAGGRQSAPGSDHPGSPDHSPLLLSPLRRSGPPLQTKPLPPSIHSARSSAEAGPPGPLPDQQTVPPRPAARQPRRFPDLPPRRRFLATTGATRGPAQRTSLASARPPCRPPGQPGLRPTGPSGPARPVPASRPRRGLVRSPPLPHWRVDSKAPAARGTLRSSVLDWPSGPARGPMRRWQLRSPQRYVRELLRSNRSERIRSRLAGRPRPAGRHRPGRDRRRRSKPSGDGDCAWNVWISREKDVRRKCEAS